jgi:hypothetical protein
MGWWRNGCGVSFAACSNWGWCGVSVLRNHRAAACDQMLHLRPHDRFEDVDGIYLTGGGIHPGLGLPVIFQSARISSRLLLEDLEIEPRW